MQVIRLVLLALFVQWGQYVHGQFSSPLKHLTLTAGYGYRIHPLTGKQSFHAGIDLRAHKDTVFAIADGVVAAAGYQSLLGMYVRVEHNGLQSIYGHLSQIGVAPGDTIVSGQAIAISGATGRVTGEHLHFSVLYQGKTIDPVKFLYHLLINQ